MIGPQVLSLGSVNADFQVRVEDRPEFGELLLAHDFVQLSGGKAANVAFIARRLGVGARLLARVGADDLGERALQPLREAGVDLSGVVAVEGSATGVAMVVVPPDGKKMIIMAANANQAWSQQDAERVGSTVGEAAAGSVLVLDYEVPGFVVQAAIEAASRAAMPVILDPSPADRVADDILKQVDFIVPDAAEAKTLTGIAIEGVEPALRAASVLLERGVKAACMKLGDGGCVIKSAQLSAHVAPVPVDVVDTTGAGDAFAGALAVALLEKQSELDAICFATAASHLAVTGYGSQPAYPTRDQLHDVLERLRSRVQVLDRRR